MLGTKNLLSSHLSNTVTKTKPQPMPSPMRSFRPDFRTIFNNLSGYEKRLSALTMDNIYDAITETVDDESLDEADTARLVKKSMLGAQPQQPEQCYKVIMQAIWPSHSKPCFIFFKNAETTDPDSDSKPETLIGRVEHALGLNATCSAGNVKIFEVIDSQSTLAIDDDTLIIEKGGRAVPLRGQICAQHPGGSYHAKQDYTTENPPDATIDANAANNATQTPPSGDSSTSDFPGSSPSHLPQPPSSGSIDDNAMHTPPSGDSSTPDPPGLSLSHLPQFLSSSSIDDNAMQVLPPDDPSNPDPPGLSPSHLPQPSSSSSIDSNATQTPPSGGPSALGPQHVMPLPGIGHHALGLFLGRGAPRGQTPPRGQGRGGHRGGHGRGTAFTPSPAVDHQFTQRINDSPMPSGRKVQRTYAFTELSPPDAQTIILGPPPPPPTPSHVRISTLPPGHPPQSYGLGASPPNHNIPGASSGNSNSGTTSETTKEAASTSSTQPIVSDQGPDLTETLKKRSRDDEDDEEGTSRRSIRLRIEAPPQSSQPDNTTTHATPVASSSTLAPSDDSEGSSDNSSPKKRIRDAEEDEEETARPSTRMRQELPAVRPRYPSPTPSDRRLGRIIAPFGTSIRFNPRPSSEADSDIGSLEAAHSEDNPQDNLPASSSGPSTLPLASSGVPSASRSSRGIKQQKAKEAVKEE